VASLWYLGGLASFYGVYLRTKYLRELPKYNDRIKMVLEDWYQPDRYARYDREVLNNRLNRLNKRKPTQTRREQKRALVASYRVNHPKQRSRLILDQSKERERET